MATRGGNVANRLPVRAVEAANVVVVASSALVVVRVMDGSVVRCKTHLEMWAHVMMWLRERQRRTQT